MVSLLSLNVMEGSQPPRPAWARMSAPGQIPSQSEPAAVHSAADGLPLYQPSSSTGRSGPLSGLSKTILSKTSPKVIRDQERSSLKGAMMTGWCGRLSPDSVAVGIGEG